MTEMPSANNFEHLVKSMPELDTEQAISDFGGLWNAYEKTAVLFVRLLPQKVENMETFLRDNDLPAFAIQAHAMRGSLNQIGYKALGTKAEKLELAAKSDDGQYCNEHYTDFKEKLMLFYDRMKVIASRERTTDNAPLDNINDFTDNIEKAWSAINDYDILLALDFLSPLADRHFEDKADSMISRAVNALEAFNAEKAVECISELRNECGFEANI